MSACGVEPSSLCQLMFDWTNNETFAAASAWIIEKPLRILLVLFLAWFVKRLANRGIDKLIDRMVHDRDEELEHEQQEASQLDSSLSATVIAKRLAFVRERSERAHQRTRTLGVLFKSVAGAVIYLAAILEVLSEFGLNLGPLIAGAGIAGVALGFGAQSIVKDLLSGIFMLIEDQYGVGDVIDCGDATGTVEVVGLRTTRIRDVSGTLWHVPNGTISRVGNYSQGWARVVLDVGVAYDTDIEAASDVIKGAADELWRENLENATIVEEPTIAGVQALDADAVVIRVMAKTEPSEQWATGRLLRQRIKVALDEAGIEIPFPQRTVWMRNGDPPAS